MILANEGIHILHAQHGRSVDHLPEVIEIEGAQLLVTHQRIGRIRQGIQREMVTRQHSRNFLCLFFGERAYINVGNAGIPAFRFAQRPASGFQALQPD